MQKIYIALLSAALLFFPAHNMDLTESRIGRPQEFSQKSEYLHPTSENEKIVSFEKQINKLSEKKQKTYKPIIGLIQSKLNSQQLTPTKTKIIDYSLKMINNTNIHFIIEEINQQKITLGNKINILTNLYSLPNPSVPLSAGINEQRELISWKDNKRELKKELNLKIEQNYKKQKNAVAKKQKEHRDISLNEWKKYQKALEQYNNILPEADPIKEEIIKKLENLTKNIQQKERRLELATLATQLRQTEKTSTIQDLQKYKTKLEAYLAHLQEPTEELSEKYQETLTNITKHIDLLTEIDKQLAIDSKEFNINELFDHIELLQKLRGCLQNVFSERYEKLDLKIKLLWNNLENKRTKRREQEELEKQKRQEEAEKQEKIEQEKLEQQRIQQEKEKQLEQMLDEMIKAEEQKQQDQARSEYQARLEQERLEQVRLEQQRIQQEKESTEKEKLAQENAKRWVPWITNQFNQARQTAINFVSTITSTVASWLSWLTGR